MNNKTLAKITALGLAAGTHSATADSSHDCEASNPIAIIAKHLKISPDHINEHAYYESRDKKSANGNSLTIPAMTSPLTLEKTTQRKDNEPELFHQQPKPLSKNRIKNWQQNYPLASQRTSGDKDWYHFQPF